MTHPIEKNAIIENIEIRIEDHGLLTAWLRLDYGDGGHQGFGGFAFYNKNFENSDRAGKFIQSILRVAGVSKWEDLPGKAVRARATLTGVSAIGHILNDDWFTPSEELRGKP